MDMVFASTTKGGVLPVAMEGRQAAREKEVLSSSGG